MFFGLNGAAAIITGAAGGMGTASARRLAREGCSIFDVDANAESLRRLTETLASEGLTEITPCVCDVTREEDANAAVAQCIEKYGKVSILVNIAGIITHRLLKDMPTREWQRVLDVNLNGVMFFCRAVLDDMIANRYGKIINMTSQAGVVGGSRERTHYSASKAGIIGLSRCLANEVAEYGINVNCIAPGIIKTPMTAGFTPKQTAAYLQKIPLGRFGEADDIAKMVEFLASDGSDYLTGQVYNVSGGWLRVS